ncbi:HAD-IIIA family hydrolase [Polynucleobacter sphagniphilus]|uniref:HAD-IIIA family hydrolase n=1 Tax=Polynucleobacter sphagniphilus TaxID=1743169 RepID=UPI00240513D3|nr:HAD-IIIA family hydrolase [Polynucleobacter sphagniphilus]MDF9787850.1 histidinol-phosphate phosphatase family protein [Polynucleobacter sphagniphilus]
MKKCNVAILAGGFGTRLKEVSGDLPKPMVHILGKPVLEHLINLCKRFDFVDIALLVHHQHELIREYFGDGSRFGVKITYCTESEPRGTAGALCDSLNILSDRFFVLYGDTYADIDMAEMWKWHLEGQADGTLLLHPNDHPHDSDLVEINSRDQVIKIHAYPCSDGVIRRNLVNAALYVLEKSALKNLIPAVGRLDLAKHIFPEMLKAGLILKGYVTPEYIKDMGTPDRLKRVENDILTGVSDRLASRNYRSCIFLDRDGTINEEVNHLCDPHQLNLLPGVGNAIRRINRSGILAVGITNQPVVARGEITVDDLDKIHFKLDYLLGLDKAYLDRLYFCPHHPDAGYPGEVQKLKIKCNCRKPGTALIDLAVRDLKIDRQASWFVGDATSDIEAGQRAGLRTILLRTGHGGSDGKYPSAPDYIFPNLSSAIGWIVEGHSFMAKQLSEILPAMISERLVLIGGPSRAGKSSVAQVLKELMSFTGRKTHIISLDGWLLPANERLEGVGVMNRYDMNAASDLLRPVINSKNRHWISIPIHDRKTRQIIKKIKTSIGPDDCVIIEGVPALIGDNFLGHTGIKIYVDVVDEIRLERLRSEYKWRGHSDEEIQSRITSRDFDELVIVRNSVINSAFQVKGYSHDFE